MYSEIEAILLTNSSSHHSRTRLIQRQLYSTTTTHLCATTTFASFEQLGRYFRSCPLFVKPTLFNMSLAQFEAEKQEYEKQVCDRLGPLHSHIPY